MQGKAVRRCVRRRGHHMARCTAQGVLRHHAEEADRGQQLHGGFQGQRHGEGGQQRLLRDGGRQHGHERGCGCAVPVRHLLDQLLGCVGP